MLDVMWTPQSTAAPKGSTGWCLNPTVEIIASSGSTEGCLVLLKLVDLDETGKGDPKFGFQVVGNPPQLPSSCPFLVPGGPLLAEAPCSDGSPTTATASLVLSAGQRVFAVPSLLNTV